MNLQKELFGDWTCQHDGIEPEDASIFDMAYVPNNLYPGESTTQEYSELDSTQRFKFKNHETEWTGRPSR